MGNPPDWHPDPTGRHDHRYWDGEQWTDHVADAGQASTDPLDSSTEQPTEATGTAWSPTDSHGTTDPAAGSAPTGTPGASTAPSFGAGSPPPGGGGGTTFPAAAPAASAPAAGASNGAAIAALILGILSLLISFIPFVGLAGTVGGIAAVILGIVGRRKVKREGATGGGMAIAGIITGALAILISLVITIGSVFFFRSFSGDFTSFVECMEQTGDERLCEDEFEENLFERFG